MSQMEFKGARGRRLSGNRPVGVKAVPFDCKVDADKRIVEGYASIFENVDLGGDRVKVGAFKRTISQRGPKGANLIKVLWQHMDPLGMPIAMSEDGVGLFTRSKISKTQLGDDALELMRDGVVDRMSIGYETIRSSAGDSDGEGDGGVRDLVELKLFEYSPVTFAMNEGAVVTAVKQLERRVDALLRGELKGPALARVLNDLINDQIDATDASLDQVVEQLADAANISQDAALAIVSGDTQVPDRQIIVDFAGELGTSAGPLLEALDEDSDGDGNDEVDDDEVDDTSSAKAEHQGALADLINEMISNRIAGTDQTRQDIIEQLASLTNSDTDAIEAILNGTTTCPTLSMLESVSTVVGASIDDLIAAGESDGCSYDVQKSLRSDGEQKDESKGVNTFDEIPILDDREREWDGDSAETAVRSWADADDGPNEQYARGFVWFDDNAPDIFESYKLLITDVIDGELTIIPRGVFAAAGAVQGARGGVDLPDEDVPTVRASLEDVYARMRELFDDDSIIAPWDQRADENEPIDDNATDIDNDQAKSLIDTFSPDTLTGRSQSPSGSATNGDSHDGDEQIDPRDAQSIIDAVKTIVKKKED